MGRWHEYKGGPPLQQPVASHPLVVGVDLSARLVDAAIGALACFIRFSSLSSFDTSRQRSLTAVVGAALNFIEEFQGSAPT
jgi:hypothetical protein